MDIEIGKDNLARILGSIEATLSAQAAASKRIEDGLASLDGKVTSQLADLEKRVRAIEVVNPAELATALKNHAERIRALESGAARAGVVSGIGTGVTMAVLIELAKRKIGM